MDQLDDTYDRKPIKPVDDKNVDELKVRRDNFLNIYKESNDADVATNSGPDLSKGIRYRQDDDE